MLTNPILALELRARWRNNRSFLLLLGVAVALSLVALFIYQRAVGTTEVSTYNTTTGVTTPAISNFDLRFTAIGRELFSALAHSNILVWLLIAAAGAATGIARERERGLLESLQLSRMSAPSQIAARFAANILLLGALQLVLLPIYAVSFLMGGVSQWEILQAFALVLASSLVGTALGLWFAARSHRPTGALFGALSVAIVLSGGAAYWIFGAVANSRFFGRTMNWESLWPALFAPNGLFWALTDPTPIWKIALWQIALAVCAIWLLASLIFCWSATRNVNRTLPPPSWQSGARWVEKLKARQAATPPRSARKSRASGALLADLPIERFVRFSDPLLAREVKARFRLRRVGWLLSALRFALFLFAIGVWLFEVFWLFDAPSRSAMAPYGLRVLLYGGTLGLAAIAATSWTREREGGTWEALKLSLLSPRDILRAKWLSPLVSFAYYSAPLWILLPIGALFVGVAAFSLGALVVVSWLGLSVALGLWMSWRVKNGTAAIAWTTGILALLLVGWPWLNALVGVDESLARSRYSVGSSRDWNEIYRPGGGYNERIVRDYQAQTGRKVAKPRRIPINGPNGMKRFFVTYDDDNVMQWLSQQQEKADDFTSRLNAWHPGEALNRLFHDSDTKVNSEAYQSSSRRRDIAQGLIASTLLPFVVTLILLMLLRRDVRREQLE